jgi:hypothetical protein
MTNQHIWEFHDVVSRLSSINLTFAAFCSTTYGGKEILMYASNPSTTLVEQNHFFGFHKGF